MKTIYNKYDKQLIPSLPRATFPGRIYVVLSKTEADRAVDFLLQQPILGFDTETRPSFKRGKMYKVSLLQVATPDICFLFRLNHTGLTPGLVKLLEDKNVLKVGLSWHDDVNSLHHLGDFKLGTFVDIQQQAKEFGIEDMSLQKLFANLFGKRISKTDQLSNWERDVLNDKQKIYAATDAWACIQLYCELERLKQTGDYELIEVEDQKEL
ncbi:MAG: 3'-5' exonuclease domain-containing protein 2 [Prevotella sp.]|jgi:ribonuclease D|nr:3'-5' exonuclease domain-containing protein 2 [Prevotella sp.]